LAVLRPTVFASVPRLYNRIYAAITNAVKESGGLKEKLFHTAYNAKRQAILSGKNSMKLIEAKYPFVVWVTDENFFCINIEA